MLRKTVLFLGLPLEALKMAIHKKLVEKMLKV